MGRTKLGKSVVAAAIDRLTTVYARGDRVIVTLSGGKDSTACLELAVIAAKKTGRLPVEAVTQDEEIAFPGTYDYLERVAQRKDVRLDWVVMGQPMLNVYSRTQPYWWCFDDRLSAQQWVRQPPAYAVRAKDQTLELMVNPARYPVSHNAIAGELYGSTPDQCLVKIVGTRAQESVKRLLGLFSSGGYITAASSIGVFACRPIYDWTEGDVWKFLLEQKADYNRAYDTLARMGETKNLRMGPPTMTLAGLKQLQAGAKAWPAWFEKLCARVPGTRTAVAFGKRACTPTRLLGESWEDCFKRECLGPETPDWIRERAELAMQKKLQAHSKHASTPFPERTPCHSCGVLNSWRALALHLWNGDPYGSKSQGVLPLIEPEFFRPGAGTWFGAVQEQLPDRKVRIG